MGSGRKTHQVPWSEPGLQAGCCSFRPDPVRLARNFGATAGIAEMLLQSQAPSAGSGQVGEIELLPALPSAWPNGEVRGLRARGGVTVDLAWKAGRVTSYRLTSAAPAKVKVRVNGEIREVTPEKI